MQCIDCLTDIGSVEIMFVAKTYFTRMGNVFILDQKYLYIGNIIVIYSRQYTCFNYFGS